MAVFGESIERAARDLEDLLPPEDGRDWTVEAAIFLALAYAAITRYERRGGLLRLANKLIVIPAIERAWQELIHIRVRVQPVHDVDRNFTVARTGRVIYEGRLTSSVDGRDHWNAVDLDQDREGDTRSRLEERYRSRRDRKRRSTKAASSGDGGGWDLGG